MSSTKSGSTAPEVGEIPNADERMLWEATDGEVDALHRARRGGAEDERVGGCAGGYADESFEVYVGKEFTPEEFAGWWGAQSLGSRPFNAVGIDHTYIPNEQQWKGLTSLNGVFAHYNQRLGWERGYGPHVWLYDGTGPYRSGEKLVYVGTHPRHDGVGIAYRNQRFLHVEAVGYFDARPMPPEMVSLYRFGLRTVCGDRIPIEDAGAGVDNPSSPIGCVFHRNAPDAGKTCPGKKVEETWFFGEMNEGARSRPNRTVRR